MAIEGNSGIFTAEYDGEVYVQNLNEHNAAFVTTPDGAKCRTAFDYHRVEGEQATIGSLTCQPVEKGAPCPTSQPHGH